MFYTANLGMGSTPEFKEVEDDSISGSGKCTRKR